LPEYGFGNQINYAASGVQNKRCFDEYELGFTFQMSKKNALYAAMFLDSGYGSIIDQKTKRVLYSYNPTSVTDRKANGVYSTDKMQQNPVAFGLTLGLNFQ
jgi:hypothetical protein